MEANIEKYFKEEASAEEELEDSGMDLLDLDPDYGKKDELTLSIRQKKQIEKKIKRFEQLTKHEYVKYGIKPIDYALFKLNGRLSPAGD